MGELKDMQCRCDERVAGDATDASDSIRHDQGGAAQNNADAQEESLWRYGWE